MPPQETQMTPDEAASSLAFITHISENMRPTAPQEGEQPTEEAPVEAETAPQPTEQPPAEETPPQEDMGAKMAEMEKSMTQKLDDIRKELKEDNQREMDALKKTITDALAE